MASTINASTSPAGIVQTADGTANLSLQSNGTTIAALTSTGMAVTGTLSASGAITATGGVVVGAAAAPAFSAYVGNSQTITLNTATKVAFNTEAFDTNSNFDSTTNYRFTPTVAGYYQINAWIYGSVAGFLEVYLYKNGALFNRLAFAYTASVQANGGSCLIYLNGSTDYIEIYAINNNTTQNNNVGQAYSYFNGAMTRSA